MFSSRNAHRIQGAGAVAVAWCTVAVVQYFSPAFDSERWHDPKTTDKEYYEMIPDLTKNVLRPGRTSSADVVRLLGPPTDVFEGSMWYELRQRPTAFDATYLIIETTPSHLVRRVQIVDH